MRRYAFRLALIGLVVSGLSLLVFEPPALARASTVHPVSALKVTAVTSTSVALAWTNPSASTFNGIEVRYAAGTKAPTFTSGHLVGTYGKTTHSATVRRLSSARTYTFAVFALGPSHSHSAAVIARAFTHSSAGSYSGTAANNLNFPVKAYVNAAGTSLQDITASLSLACAPGGSTFSETLIIPNAAIAANGSFNRTSARNGVVRESGNNYAATFGARFTGRFNGTTAAGTLHETMSYNNGVAQTCTSNTMPFAITLESQGRQTATAPPAGSYSGLGFNNLNDPVSFYVAAGGTSIQDVTAAVYPNCVPNNVTLNNLALFLTIPSLAIAADGSFSHTTVTNGVIRISGHNYATSVTDNVTGHFHSVNGSGVERAAGTYQETITYNDGVDESCSSDLTPFAVTRDNQGAQTTTPPPAGSYSGLGFNNLNYPVSFSVAAGGTSIQNVSATEYPSCYPNDVVLGGQTMTIPSITINADQSFSATSETMGTVTVNSTTYAATFNATFNGHFHSVNNSGRTRAAGIYSETITYNDGVDETCSSNLVPFYVTN